MFKMQMYKKNHEDLILYKQAGLLTNLQSDLPKTLRNGVFCYNLLICKEESTHVSP